jgi:Flp pilus assembly protein TadG
MPLSYCMQAKLSAARKEETGQVLLEFAISLTMMMVLIFGIVDFSRAIYERQVMCNLASEGSSMASRGTSGDIAQNLSTTASALVSSSYPFNLNTNGKVIISAVFNNNQSLLLTAQSSLGSLAATSKVGSSIGGAATLPLSAIPPINQTVYVTEIFSLYSSITPIGNFVSGLTMSNQIYEAAYY